MKAAEAPQPITSIQMAVSKDPAHNFALDVGSRRLRCRRGDEGAAARHGRDALQRQRPGGIRAAR